MLHRSEMYQEFAVRRRSLVDSRRSCSDVQSGSWFELLDDADVADLEPALGLVNRCPSASQLPLQHLKGILTLLGASWMKSSAAGLA